MRHTSHSAGFTLIELMLGIVVMAILLAIAVPSFTSQFQKQRLKGAGERLVSEIQFARSQAIGGNEPIFVKVKSGADWCIGVGTESDCDCDPESGSPLCKIDGNDRIVTADKFDGVTMAAVTSTIEFDTVRGLPDPDDVPKDVDFDGENDKRVGVRVNQLGTVRICSPEGDKKVGDYPDC